MEGERSVRIPTPTGRDADPAVLPVLDRRFEAVVLWSTEPDISPRTARDLLALCDAGVPVAWLAPTPVDVMAGRLGELADGAPFILLADSGGTGTLALDHSGVHRVDTPQPELDLAALDQAGRAFAQRMAEMGIPTLLPHRRDRSFKVAIDLFREPSPGAKETPLKQLLLAHGILSLSHLARLAGEVARQEGLDGARVVVESSRVEIALADAGDVAVRVLGELWRRGVDPQGVLMVVDGLSGVPHRPAPIVTPDVRTATVVSVHGGRGSPRLGMVALTGGSTRLHQLLADQLRRRRRRALPELITQVGWCLDVEGFDPITERVNEAHLTLADGHVGMSGAPLAPDPARHPWVVTAGIYEGTDADTHLVTAPVAFELTGAGTGLPLRRVLDLRAGILHEHWGSGSDAVASVRFLSPARPTTAVLRCRFQQGSRVGPPLLPPADDPVLDQGRVGDTTWIRVASAPGGTVAAATQRWAAKPGRASGAVTDGRVLDRTAVYHSDPDVLPDPTPTVEAVSQAAAIGFDRLLTEHRQTWARRWEDADVVIEGDDELQLGVRFALFHLMASVADHGEASVGARGLTGTGYRGHVFWDADTFVLPFLAATHPESARSMLEYRLRRLPAALEAARSVGRAGARFPWESARTGQDVTPTSARDRSGRVVPIRTGQLEEHIVAQVPWAACCYVEWSGDDEFDRGPCRRILVETARYWASRIRVQPDGSAHIYGVVGPDEYHEPVDDNACTNVMARWNLRRAASAVEAAGDDDVDEAECRRWRELADAMFDGYDSDTGVYEQFAGFSRLEPLVIAEIASRRPIAADLLLGTERTQGAQVIKQADVLMLHHLLPDEVVPGSLEPNLRFYEPRTAHGSSLSPAIHASLLARGRDFDRALEAMHIATRMDLDDLTGSTGQGLHLATMGGAWQALAFGFMGLRPRDAMLHIDPVLPPSWSALEMRVQFRGSRVRVRKERDRLEIQADKRVSLAVSSEPFVAGPGSLAFRRRGARWEPIA